jgi:ADP-ribosylglycohydrolase
MTDSEQTAIARARLALDGLSVGDALGERFFGPEASTLERIQRREVPPPAWRFTDDTEMALAVTQTLLEHRGIDPDTLARHFAERYERDPYRGYGGGAQRLLQALARGAPWQQASPALFDGGSFGNGSAMRVAPVGGYFATDLGRAAEHAAASARVTHSHPEGIAGAVAVAVAAALAWQQAEAGRLDGAAMLATVLALTPSGEKHDRLGEAAAIGAGAQVAEVARRLGSGQRVSSQDTVPFALWCAARHLASYEECFWATVRGLGDRDTTCAISCGVVALSARRIPEDWLRGREPLPSLG